MDKNTAQAIFNFLMNTPLKGSEAPAFVQCLKVLQAIMNAPAEEPKATE